MWFITITYVLKCLKHFLNFIIDIIMSTFRIFWNHSISNFQRGYQEEGFPTFPFSWRMRQHPSLKHHGFKILEYCVVLSVQIVSWILVQSIMTDLQTWLVCFIFCVLTCSKNLAMCFGCERLQQIRVLTLICQKLNWRYWLLIQESKHPVLQLQWKWLYTWRKTTVTSRHQLPLSMLSKTVLVSINVFYILWVSTVTYATAPLLKTVKGTVFVVKFWSTI